MEGLRVILLLVGALVIAGVYAYTRSSRRGGGARTAEPTVAGGSDAGADDEFPDGLPPLHAAEPDGRDDDEGNVSRARETSGTQDEKIIVLNIMPVEPGETFPGADLLDVFDRAGLEYGQFGVFHRVKESTEGPLSVFSVASATEPGSFDITGMAEERFRGLSLFMLLPGPMRGVDAFADMLATARRIAEQIRGEVKDRDRSTLTRQTARHLREEIIAFEHRFAVKSEP